MSDNNQFEEDDDFYDEDDLPQLSRWKIIGAALAFVIVVGFGVGIWYAYDQGVKKGVQLAPPIIKADSDPVKKDPEDRGGMEIAHQDKEVFDVLKADKGEEKVEKLMEAPEEATPEAAPVDITETVKEGTVNDINKDGAETLMAKPAEDAAKMAPKAEDKMAKATEDAKEEAKKVVAEKVEKVIEPAAKMPEKPAVKPAPVVAAKPPAAPKKAAEIASANYRVQLGAFRSVDAAEKAWTDLQKAHKSLLGTVPHRVQSVEIKGKGMFHRLQAGAFADKAEASSLCGDLKAEKQDCLVAKN